MATNYGAITYGDLGETKLVSDLSKGFRFAPSAQASPLQRAYEQQEAQRYRMAMESEKQMKLQTQAMQLEYDKMKSQADTSGKMAAEFLQAWGSSLNQVASMYGDASKVLKDLISGQSGGAVSSQLSGIRELSDLMKQEYTTYKEQYAPLEKEFMTHARDTAQEKRAIQREIAKGGGAWTDTEGAAARAKVDTSIQGELQNQAEARRLMALGIDPSSGRFGALTRKGAIDLAGETARAMNLARQAEKTQGLARATSAASALSPSEYYDIAKGIRGQGTDILKSAGALEQAGAGIQSQYLSTMGNLGTSYANLASGMAQNIANPLAEMAGYYAGLSGGNTGAISPSSIFSTNPMASYQAATGSSYTPAGAITQPTSQLATSKNVLQKAKNATYGNSSWNEKVWGADTSDWNAYMASR